MTPPAPRALARSIEHRFDALQVLRALAAALVVFSHALSNWQEKGLPTAPMPQFPAMGDLGVRLFFCISGFIIVHSAWKLPTGPAGTRLFWVRRMARIVPLYWLMTSVYLLRKWLGAEWPSLQHIGLSYAFVPYRNELGLVQPILGVGWSLNHEMFFYFVFGLILLLPRRAHAWVLSAVMAALAGARVSGWLGPENGSLAHDALLHWADPIILYFVAGVLIGSVLRARGSPQRLRLSPGPAALLACALVLLQAVLIASRWPELQEWTRPVVCIAALVLCVAARPDPLGAAWAPAILAGDASYSTYLTHGFLMGPMAVVLARLSLPVGHYGFAFISLLGCTLLGVAVYRWVEQPLNRRFRDRPAPHA